MTRTTPKAHPCGRCGAALAPFGFTLRDMDEEGQTRTVVLWFCRECRAAGLDLWRASMERHAPGRLRAMAVPIEAPAQGRLL